MIARQEGLTLVELLVALAICALVLGPLASMLDTSMRVGARSAAHATLEQDLDFALERIAGAARATPRKAPGPGDAALVDSGGLLDKSRFRVNANRQLIEVRDGVDNVVAEAVATFGIGARAVAADTTLIEATLRLESGAESVQGSVAVRMGGPRK
jgi:prepilin-type N-terminal cleavage/methylation domain-containing protein